MHADFTRVSEHDHVDVEISVELRGEAPGVKEGGVVEHLTHQVNLRCVVTDIPEKLFVNVNHLSLGESITLADLELPEKATLLDNEDTVVVHCVQPTVEAEEEEGEAEAAEPEVIGRKEEESENE